MKFGKQIQRQQLDLPEYAPSFLNYKALKKLIKQLSATPTIAAQSAGESVDAKDALRANKEVFFFRLEREIERVNVFYLQKEEEFSLRLKTLLDRKRVVQVRLSQSSKAVTSFVGVVEGFQQFDNDLNKLQQFVEVNETAVSKILKKWDKTSKSKTKALYLQRAVEIQPCFNRDVLRDLADRATTARLELEAWAEGENVQYDTTRPVDRSVGQRVGTEESDIDLQVLQAAVSGNVASLREWLTRLSTSPKAGERFTRIFLASICDAPNDSLSLLLQSGLIDIQAEDDVNERNMLHEAAIYGKDLVLDYGIRNGLEVSRVDVYGRIPLHYACLKGRVQMSQLLIETGPNTVDLKDHDNFTALIHSIIRHKVDCVRQLLAYNAQIDPDSEVDRLPLNLACQHESTEVATLLLEKNARLLPDAEGLFPQHLVARSSRSSELLSLLKQHGADLNQRDKLYSWTPLFHAASEGRTECLRFLLENGADANALDEKGLTAMYYATWEGNVDCMNLLWERSSHRAQERRANEMLGVLAPPQPSAMEYTLPQPTETDGIPDLSLPPPIIPLRRYGHNFLEGKTYVSINFHRGADSIRFFNEGRYPAARITIFSKTSDLIPRNIILPIQDDSRNISFQVDDLDTFGVDFEIFPTFGSKVIAKSVALTDVFRAIKSSSGACCLPLFDPRLRAIGQIQFTFQVVKPYSGIPLEIAQFATYWKSTSAIDDHSGLVTGSSLTGDYVKFAVTLTRDAVPVLYHRHALEHNGIEVPIAHLDYTRIVELGLQSEGLRKLRQTMAVIQLDELHASLSGSLVTLQETLAVLPTNININVEILYPSLEDEIHLGMAPAVNINVFVDSILTVIFNHARHLKEQNPEYNRSIVFSSSNPRLCAAINWKQPNYSVLLLNDLAERPKSVEQQAGISLRPSLSLKESARIAQSNNLMGIICNRDILDMAPALVETIKEAGSILVSDSSQVAEGSDYAPEGVNGVMKRNGTLNFYETLEM